MTHPTREEWMSYLYDELPAPTKSALQVHLEVCAECRSEMETWTRATHRLNDWPLPKRRAKHRFAEPVLKWAAAAAIVALAAIGGTRLWALNGEVTQLRADVQGSLKREVESAVRVKLSEKFARDLQAALVQVQDSAAKTGSAEAEALIAEFARALETKRLEEQRAMLAALQQLQTRQAEDYAGLRNELETVAVFAEAGLQRAQNQIANIAYTSE